jgi:membrane-associated phospholipid phosphatase
LLQDVVGSRPEGTNPSKRKTQYVPSLPWSVSLILSTLAVVVTFRYFDVPIAVRVQFMLSSAHTLASGFASTVLLTIESGMALILIWIRITRGHLSPLAKATMLACLTSICAYAINDSTLKYAFGVPSPAAVLHGSRHAFHLLGGSAQSSFPSGHMVLSGAFAGVFMRLFRWSILPLSVLLLVAAVLLIVGDWHFVSDVIAGTFIGVSAGLLAGELSLLHSN